MNLNLNVMTGDSIYFVLNQNGHVGSDATSWDPSIAF